MVASSEVMCVVCEKNVAKVWCEQDAASLCLACDQQVHSANPLASRHVRVAICAHAKQDEQAVPQVRSVFDADPRAPQQEARKESLSFDDDAFFVVPDVDLPGFATDEGAAKNVLGKTFVSDEFDFGEIDPLWLDRLDVGLDRLPSDILDSLVPEAPPPAKAAANVAEAHAAPASPSRELMHPPLQHAHSHMNHHHHPTAHPVHVPAHAAMHHYAPHTMVPHYAPTVEAPPAAKWEQPPPAPVEAPLDIDSYIPRSLLPVDPSVRVQLLRARREKLERFREKKRTRHFKKTIRYASRKAYAEVRPRIKGRFARKDEVAAMRAAGLLPAV